MRRPEKSSRLYQELRDSILMRKFQPGMMLPRETELAETFGVSRDTLRAALAQLENEALVRRVRGKGTYVSSRKERPRLTFLLPCPDSICRSSYFLMEIFQGVMEAAHKLDCQVETLALSPTNDPEDLDWSQLFNINRDSRVVVVGFWFAGIFDFLVKSGCRVVMVHDGTFHKQVYAEVLNRWIIFEKGQFDIAWRMTRQLIASGCRRPILFSNYLNEEKQPRVLGVKTALQEAGLPFQGIPVLRYQETSAEKQEIFRQSWEAFQFDGFLADDIDVLTAAAALGSKLKCGFFDYHQNSQGIISEQAFYSEFPLRRIGFEAVAELLKEPFKPQKREYLAKLYDIQGHEL